MSAAAFDAPGPARAILEVLWGPLGGRRSVIEPGTELLVGRADPAGLVIPNDRQMSGVHFAVAWDGASATIRDLGSAAGTSVNGQPVFETSAGQGSWIRAGDTVFRIHVEAIPDPAIAAAEAAHAALKQLRGEPALFAVLDAARSPRILELLRASVAEQQSLYEGQQGHLLADVAPYLVALRRGLLSPSPLLAPLVLEGWGKSWGIYLTSRRPFVEVRRHLRRISRVDVEGQGGRITHAYFRFYDPRVLRTFVPMVSPRQREETFGDITSFLVESERGEVLRFDKDSPD